MTVGLEPPLIDARALRWPGWLLGFALGGFADGILFHQVLQWHHLLSGVDRPGHHERGILNPVREPNLRQASRCSVRGGGGAPLPSVDRTSRTARCNRECDAMYGSQGRPLSRPVNEPQSG